MFDVKVCNAIVLWPSMNSVSCVATIKFDRQPKSYIFHEIKEEKKTVARHCSIRSFGCHLLASFIQYQNISDYYFDPDVIDRVGAINLSVNIMNNLAL